MLSHAKLSDHASAVRSQPLPMTGVFSTAPGQPALQREGSESAAVDLAHAFSTFSEAADLLQRSYGQLQIQVAGLRHELEETNRDLVRSLEENDSMRKHLHSILKGLPCGVLACDDGSVSIANPEALRLMGWDASRDLRDLRSIPDHWCAVLGYAQRKGGEVEYASVLPSGELIWMVIRHALVERSGDHTSSIFIFRDIGEQKRLAQEREKLRREQALADVSRVLAHEIRNPLASLELFAGLLAETEQRDENREWIEHIQAGLRTLGATVNNVLNLHTGSPADPLPIDSGELLHWAEEFLRPLARQSGVFLEIRNELRGVELRADRHSLEQVVLNLALNAFRVMPGGGWFRLSGRLACGQTGPVVEILAADTGSGLPLADLTRIFDPGFTTRPGSPGLGLAVCRKIVEQHGGTISASHRPSGGALFRMTFPMNGVSQ